MQVFCLLSFLLIKFQEAIDKHLNQNLKTEFTVDNISLVYCFYIVYYNIIIFFVSFLFQFYAFEQLSVKNVSPFILFENC